MSVGSRSRRGGALGALAAAVATVGLLLGGCRATATSGAAEPEDHATAATSAPGSSGSPGTPDDSGTATADPTADDLVYVAMGDSYTAAPLFPLQDRETIDSCLRSSQNYPTLVAADLGIDVIDVSCSGATTTSMFSKQKFSDRSRPPQLDALRRHDADLVTLGIGANDFRYFSKMIFTCLEVARRDPEGEPCREKNTTPAGKDRIEKHLGQIRHNVARVIRAIGKRAPDARILLVGYPQLLPEQGTCTAKLPLALGDYAYARELNLRLAAAVKQGGMRGGAEFVDLVEASQGHDICSKQPWVAGVRGDPQRAMGLHPYPAEQRAVAELITSML